MSSIFYSSGRLTELATLLSKDHCSRNYLVKTIMNLRPAKLVGMFISGKKWVLFIIGCWSEQALRSVGNLEVGIFHLVFIHSESTHGRYAAELWLTENEGATYNRSLPVTGYYASGFNHPPGGIANNKIYKVYYNFMHSKIREKNNRFLSILSLRNMVLLPIGLQFAMYQHPRARLINLKMIVFFLSLNVLEVDLKEPSGCRRVNYPGSQLSFGGFRR